MFRRQRCLHWSRFFRTHPLPLEVGSYWLLTLKIFPEKPVQNHAWAQTLASVSFSRES